MNEKSEWNESDRNHFVLRRGGEGGGHVWERATSLTQKEVSYKDSSERCERLKFGGPGGVSPAFVQ